MPNTDKALEKAIRDAAGTYDFTKLDLDTSTGQLYEKILGGKRGRLLGQIKISPVTSQPIWDLVYRPADLGGLLNSLGLGMNTPYMFHGSAYVGPNASLGYDLKSGQTLTESLSEQDLFTRGMETITGLEKRLQPLLHPAGISAEEMEARRGGRALAGARHQDLITRGLAGTTVVGDVQQGAYNQMQRAVGSIRDKRRQQQIGTQMDLAKLKLGFLQPNIGFFARLQSALNQNNPGYYNPSLPSG